MDLELEEKVGGARRNASQLSGDAKALDAGGKGSRGLGTVLAQEVGGNTSDVRSSLDAMSAYQS